jgi:membrane protein DedA with SNARE-associated domain
MRSILTSTNDRSAEFAISAFSHDDDEAYNLPLWPKIALIINFNTAIWTAITILILYIIKKSADVQHIIDLSNLMMCFFIGAAVAAASIWLDGAARNLYRMERTRYNKFAKWADVFDFSALGAMLASIVIFVWGCWWGASILRSELF